MNCIKDFGPAVDDSLVLIAYAQKPSLNFQAYTSRRARGLNIGLEFSSATISQV